VPNPVDTFDSDTLCGRHPVLAALKAGRPCQRLLLARGSHGASIDEILALARQRDIPYDFAERRHLDRLAGPGHQGVAAVLAPRAYADCDELLASAARDAAFVVFLDSIEDPHNLGAILRSAHAVGAAGVVIPARHACGLTPAAVKAAAGAAEYLPVCRVTNLREALARARRAGLWLRGLAADGTAEFADVDWRLPCGVVIGGEQKGLRRLVRDACDQIVRIPMARHEVGSLNASVAAAIVLYEVFRQRRGSRSAP